MMVSSYPMAVGEGTQFDSPLHMADPDTNAFEEPARSGTEPTIR
jgi:hypothetical protein